jgi:hypothetical protein
MPFPLRVGPHTFATAPELGAAAARDAREGGGSVVAGQAPSAWIVRAVAAGGLTAAEAIALGASLVDSTEPGGVAEGARLLAALRDPRCADLIEAALHGDVGLMLASDPIVAGQSVEDALLRALAAVADLDDGTTRGRLLERLRNAAMGEIELRVLALHGTPDEIREFVPPLLAEGAPRGAADALAAAARRGPDVALAVIDATAALRG